MIRAYGRHVVLRREALTLPPDVKRRIRTRRGAEVVLESGIVVPDAALAKATWGIVISVGPWADPDLTPGDRVAIPWTWKRPYVDSDLGEVEILESDEIEAFEDASVECDLGHRHSNEVQAERCRQTPPARE